VLDLVVSRRLDDVRLRRCLRAGRSPLGERATGSGPLLPGQLLGLTSGIALASALGRTVGGQAGAWRDCLEAERPGRQVSGVGRLFF
jgi:hypothetical protein